MCAFVGLLTKCQYPPPLFHKTLWCSAKLRKGITFLNVMLTVHHSISVQWNQRDALFIHLIKN
jgi:hypothetical protein